FLGTLDLTTRSQAEAGAENLLVHFRHLRRYTDTYATKAAELTRAGITGAAQGAAMRAWNTEEGDALRPVAKDRDRLDEAANKLERLIREGGGKAASTPAGRAGFMIRAIASLA